MPVFEVNGQLFHFYSTKITVFVIFSIALFLNITGSIWGQNNLDKNFPADFTSVVNVKTQYGAKGDGNTDDTQAIQRAINENVGSNRILYFPNGTYIVSNRLEWRRPQDAARPWTAFLGITGQNRTTTIIRLRDDAPGYSDSNNPKAVVFTASDDFTPRDQNPRAGYMETGTGNEAFGNYIENLTVDTGNNRGAIGIDYLASNTGAIRNVTARGQGIAGIALIRALQGPELIKNVSVEGFDYGILARDAVYAATFEHISVVNQRIAGISNQGQIALSIRDLFSRNTVPALQNLDSLSLITLIDANLTAGFGAISAIENRGQLFARNINTNGYRSAITHNNNAIAGNTVSEWVSAQPFKMFSSETHSLNLPVEETPEYHDNVFNNWANVVNFGAQPNDLWNDDTGAVQAALNSGKSTIYLPQGVYIISQTLHVPPTVKRIIGGDWGIGWGAFADANNPTPLFLIEGNTDEPVTIERLSISRKHTNANSPLHRGLIIVEHASPRPLVLKDLTTMTDRISGTYRSAAGAGKVFLEDVAASQFFFDQKQQVWARQLNPESLDELRIRNNNTDLWILGLKTEGFGSIIETNAGGSTEVLGGNLFSTTPPASPLPPAFINNNGRVSLSYTTTAYSPWTADFPVHITELRGSETKNLLFGDLVERGYGRIVPLYVGFQASSASANSAPFGGAPRLAPGKIEAEDFDEGGESVSYHDADTGNNGGTGYRSGGVDIRESPGGAGKNYVVGWVNSGEWLKYTVNVQLPGSYDIEFNVASLYPNSALHLEDQAGNNLTGPITVDNTGGWDIFRNFVKKNVNLPAGVNSYRVVVDYGAFDFNSWQISNAITGIADGIYEIEPSSAPGMRLNVAGNTDGDGVNVDIYHDVDGSGQRWRLIHISDDWYELSPVAAPARRLDLYGFGAANGTDIKIWQSTNAANQRWRLVDVGNGLYEFAPQYAQHLRMDVQALGTSDGTNVYAWESNQGNNQRWRLYRQ